jgi:DNA-binding transcriptional MerR regulator
MGQHVERFFAKDVAKQCGLNAITIRRLADAGKIPSGVDYNGWRVFNERSVEIAKRLAFGELANYEGSEKER